MQSDDKLIDKINKLFAKAERAGSQAEAEAYFAKAQQLQTRYAIDEAVLAAGRLGHDVVIEHDTVNIGTDRSKQYLFMTVCKYNNCHTFAETSGYWTKSGQYRSRCADYVIYGVRSDIQFCKLLYTHLLMTCERNLSIMRELMPKEFKGKSYAYNYRIGFASAVGLKLKQARDVAMNEAGEPGTELVLVSRSARVRDKMDQENPDLSPRSDIAIRDETAYSTGIAHGRNADVSGGRNTLRERPSLTA